MAEAKKCRIENCKRPYRAKGYCNAHFRKWRAGEIEGHDARYKICKEENCKKPMYKKGLCEPHYQALMASKKGVPAAEAASTAAPAAPEAAAGETPTAETPPTA